MCVRDVYTHVSLKQHHVENEAYTTVLSLTSFEHSSFSFVYELTVVCKLRAPCIARRWTLKIYYNKMTKKQNDKIAKIFMYRQLVHLSLIHISEPTRPY